MVKKAKKPMKKGDKMPMPKCPDAPMHKGAGKKACC